MELREAIEARTCVRSFTTEDVDPQTIERLLRAAVRAPTAGNLQPWRFHVVRDPGVKRALARAAMGQSSVERAPVVIVVEAETGASGRGYGSRGEELYAIQDTAAAVQNILLSVVAEGLGACWVGAFDERAAASALSLPRGIRPLAMVPVGHPAGRTRPTRREPHEMFTKYV